MALGVRLARQPGNKLNMATGFALAFVTMLAVSPVARAHYFLLLAPAILFVPLWLDRHGRPRAGVVMAAILPVLSILHYALLPYGGRIGLLGFGTAAWLMAAMVLIARADRKMVQATHGKRTTVILTHCSAGPHERSGGLTAVQRVLPPPLPASSASP